MINETLAVHFQKIQLCWKINSKYVSGKLAEKDMASCKLSRFSEVT